MAGTIIFLTIWIGVSLIFVGIGFSASKSEKPVGINTSEKLPKAEEFTDVKAYNRAHGKLWLGFAGIFDLIGIMWIFFGRLGGEKQNVSTFLTLIMILFVFGAVGMVELIHERLLKKYKK